jgi:ABC-2 type transport system ATP-binding protein
MTFAIEAIDVAKTYRARGGQVHALRGLSLQVPRGLVYGLLGPNGAGKSTLLRIVLGLVNATSGQCRLLDGPVTDVKTRRRVGALIESPTIYPFLTAAQTLEMLARTSGFRDPNRIKPLLELVGLAEAANRRVRSFSLGMKQRLGVAAALLTRPELIILDEPTNGLDPAGITEMRGLMRRLVREEGVSIVLSSHLMGEVQQTCDRVAIMNHGQLVAEGGVADLLAARGRLTLRVADTAAALAVLGARGSALADGLAVDIPREATPALVRELVAASIDIHEVRWTEPSLESVFLQLTGGA